MLILNYRLHLNLDLVVFDSEFLYSELRIFCCPWIRISVFPIGQINANNVDPVANTTQAISACEVRALTFRLLA